MELIMFLGFGFFFVYSSAFFERRNNLINAAL